MFFHYGHDPHHTQNLLLLREEIFWLRKWVGQTFYFVAMKKKKRKKILVPVVNKQAYTKWKGKHWSRGNGWIFLLFPV